MRGLILLRRICCLGFATLLSACAGGAPESGIAPPPPLAQNARPDSPCAYSFFLRGRYHELALQFEQALSAYDQALRCDPESDYISARIPLLLLQLEREDQALLWLEAFLVQHPQHSGMRMLYANILLRQRKNTQAMEQYQLIADQHPDDPAVLLLLAEMYLGDNQLSRARPVLQRVMQLDPRGYLGHVLMARLSAAENKSGDAGFHYRKALARNWSAELQMEFAGMYVAAGRYDEAARLYQELLRREEFNEEARLTLVQLRFLQQKDGAAMAELKRLRNYVDEPQRVDLTIAQLYARQKQFTRAISLVREVLEQEELPAARYFLAALLAQEQQYQAALEQLERLGESGEDDGEFPEAFVLRIRLLQELNRLDEAVALLEKELEADKIQNVDLYLLFAGLYQTRGQADKAIEVLEKALRQYPDNEHLLYDYALHLENRGRHTAAIKAMLQLVAVNPAHVEALNFVGYVWAEQGINLDQALIYLEEAVRLKPDSGHIRDSLGWVYYRLGRFKDAIRELERAQRLSVKDPLVFEHLGDAYVADRQIKRARVQYDKALERLPAEDQEGRKRILRKKSVIEKEKVRP